MKKCFKRMSLVITLVCCTVFVSFSQQIQFLLTVPVGTWSSFEVRDYDTNELIPNVVILHNESYVMTSASGRFSISGIASAAGIYTVFGQYHEPARFELRVVCYEKTSLKNDYAVGIIRLKKRYYAVLQETRGQKQEPVRKKDTERILGSQILGILKLSEIG